MAARASHGALLAAVAAAALALGAAAWLYLDSGRREAAVPEIAGYVFSKPRALPAIELVDEHGAAFRTADFAGRWSLLYFGYTYCPDVCPLTLVELAALKRRLADRGFVTPVAYYLVSVDPRRDTPARLREYVAYFDAEFHALTGTPDALAALARATETLYDVPAEPSGDNYLVSHSSNVVVLDPQGAVRAVFTPPQSAATLATDFPAVVEHYAGRR